MLPPACLPPARRHLCRLPSPPLPPPATAATRSQEDAEYDVIRKAYKRLSLQWHPDKLPQEREQEGREMFQKINSAYQVCEGGGRRRRGFNSEGGLQFRGSRARVFSGAPSLMPPITRTVCRDHPPPALVCRAACCCPCCLPQKLVNDEGDSEDEDEYGFDDSSSSFDRMYDFFQYM